MTSLKAYLTGELKCLKKEIKNWEKGATGTDVSDNDCGWNAPDVSGCEACILVALRGVSCSKAESDLRNYQDTYHDEKPKKAKAIAKKILKGLTKLEAELETCIKALRGKR